MYVIPVAGAATVWLLVLAQQTLYSVTPTLSFEASHANEMLYGVVQFRELTPIGAPAQVSSAGK